MEKESITEIFDKVKVLETKVEHGIENDNRLADKVEDNDKRISQLDSKLKEYDRRIDLAFDRMDKAYDSTGKETLDDMKSQFSALSKDFTSLQSKVNNMNEIIRDHQRVLTGSVQKLDKWYKIGSLGYYGSVGLFLLAMSFGAINISSGIHKAVSDLGPIIQSIFRGQ